MTGIKAGDEIRWEPTEGGGLAGRIGDLDAFQISMSAAGEKWTWHLTSALPGQQDDHGWAMDPIVCKVTAARWYETYLSARPYVAAALAGLRAEIEDERKVQDEIAAEHAEWGREGQSVFCYGRVKALDWVLAMMDRMEEGQ